MEESNLKNEKCVNDSNMLLKPKYDVVFQSLFSDKNKQETGYFISAILGRKVQILKVITEVSKMREFPEEKIGRMDLIAYTNEELIHIEIQLVDYLNTTSRLIYSMSQNISKQLMRGDDYNKITKTITIGLLNYSMKELKELKSMHTIWNLRENKSNEKKLTDLIEFHIIDMSKAKEEYNKDKNNKLAEWILFILDPNMQEVKYIMNENEEIKKTAQKLENISNDEDIRARAEILARWEMEERMNKQSLIDYAKKIVEEGKAKNEAEGRAKGIAKGIEEGKEKGRIEGKIEGKKEGERNKTLEIAKRMLENSIDIDIISKVTGLTKEEVNNLSD